MLFEVTSFITSFAQVVVIAFGIAVIQCTDISFSLEMTVIEENVISSLQYNYGNQTIREISPLPTSVIQSTTTHSKIVSKDAWNSLNS